MKIFVWNGSITQAYHDDGTCVVLANTLEEARKIAWDTYGNKTDYEYGGVDKRIFTEEPEIIEIDKPKGITINYGGDD